MQEEKLGRILGVIAAIAEIIVRFVQDEVSIIGGVVVMAIVLHFTKYRKIGSAMFFSGLVTLLLLVAVIAIVGVATDNPALYQLY